MKPGVKYGLYLAATWIAFKLILFQFDLGQDEMVYGVFGNLLLILIAIFLTIYEVSRKREGDAPMTFLSDLKSGMQAAGVYAVVVTGFIFVQYTVIQPNYLQDRIDAKVEEAKKQDYEKVQKRNDLLKDVSRQEYIEKVREDHEQINSLKLIIPFYLLGMMFIGLVYTFLVTLLNRKVWSHFQ